VRINPDVDAGSHPHISTGAHTTKFGVSVDEARAMIGDMRGRPSLRVIGLHVHIGSQVTDPAPLAKAAETVADLALSFRASGVPLSTSTSAAASASPIVRTSR
jgi:diaminopimelate decarboxylase